MTPLTRAVRRSSSDDAAMAALTIRLLDNRGEDIIQSFDSVLKKVDMPADERASLARCVLASAREYFMEYCIPSDSEIPPDIRDNMDLSPIAPSYLALVDPEVYEQATKRPTLHLQVSLTCAVPPMPEFNWMHSGVWWYVTIPSSQLERLASCPTVERIVLEKAL